MMMTTQTHNSTTTDRQTALYSGVPGGAVHTRTVHGDSWTDEQFQIGKHTLALGGQWLLKRCSKLTSFLSGTR